MFFYAITGLINAVASTFLGLLVYYKNRKEGINKTFALFCLSVAIWSYAYFIWQISTTAESALFWTRVLMVGAIFIPVAYFYFIITFLKLYQLKKTLLYLGYLFSLFFLVLNFTPFFVEKVEPTFSFSHWPKPGIAYHPFLLMFFGYVIYSWYLMFQALKKTTGTKALQIKYVLFGTFIGFLGGSTNYFLWYNIPIPPLGNGLVAFYILFIALAILKYHLFEIKVILTELLVAVMGIVLLVLPFLMPSPELKLLTGFVLFLFILFGYLLINYTHLEIKRKEEAEAMAIRERVLREETERLNKELQEAYKNIEALSNIKSEFLKIANHQLRTPVSVVMSYLSLLQEGSIKGEEKIKKTINNTYLASQRLIIILDDLLNAQELIGEKPILNLRSCQIEEIIEGVIEHFKFFADEKKLILNFQKPKEPLPQILLDGDRIERAVKKLVDNAILYTPKGKINISANLIKEDEKKFAQIQIKDTGIGIIEEDKKKIFKPFSRGEEGLKMHPNGSGLGLFIAKENIEAQQGKIGVETEGKNKGTTFTITLPIDTKI